MIRVYMTTIIDQAQSFDALSNRILLNVGLKKEIWRSMSKDIALESVCGILLLQEAMKRNGLTPSSCIYTSETSGRPYLLNQNIDFSISHSHGTIICAIEAKKGLHRIGVDVELYGKRNQTCMKLITNRYFSDNEKRIYQADPTEKTFMDIWTAKESLVKMSGKGLEDMLFVDSTNPPSEISTKRFCFDKGVISLSYHTGSIPPDKIINVRL